VEGVGPITLKRIQAYFGDLASAWAANAIDLQAVEGIGSKLATAIAQQRPNLDLTPPAVPFLTPADGAYPALLFEIPDPPPVLYYQGQLELLPQCQTQPAAAIVGTRSPSDYGRRWTRRISAALSRAGLTVVSGLADGIDREAHDSCLQHQGSTIAVLGTGVDVVYPRQNLDLHRAIAQRGLLLSEHPPGTPPDRVHFPRRNRIIAGLSRATLVTEAPAKSGALITARLANDYGRDVYVLPGSLDNPRCRGCLELVNQGAQLVLAEDTLVAALGAIPVESLPQSPTAAATPRSTAGFGPAAPGCLAMPTRRNLGPGYHGGKDRQPHHGRGAQRFNPVGADGPRQSTARWSLPAGIGRTLPPHPHDWSHFADGLCPLASPPAFQQFR
jgi:DNA processing protein